MAEYFKWQDEFNTSIKSIDNQHKRLIELINKLYAAFVEHKTNDAMREILCELTEYTLTHFKFEEFLFKQVNYGKAAMHIQEHNSFVKQIEEFKTKNEKTNYTITFSVLNFLREWLKNHIMVSDKEYVLSFKQNGII